MTSAELPGRTSPPANSRGAGNRLEGALRSLAAATPFLAAVAVFLPGLDNGLVSDDWHFLYFAHAAASVRDAVTPGGATGWFVRPLQWLLTFVLVRLAGTTPWPYHLTSLVVHLGNGALLALLARRLLISTGAAHRARAISLCATLLFLLDPHQGESVLWYSAVSEELATAFRLLGLLALWRTLTVERASGRWTVAGLGCFLLALSAKESAVSFPLECALLAGLAVATRSDRRRTTMRRGLVFVGIAAAVACSWAFAYADQAIPLHTSRAGVTLLEPDPIAWIARMARAVTLTLGRGLGTAGLVGVMATAILVAVTVVLAWRRRRALWFFSLFWLLSAWLPFVALTTTAEIAAATPAAHRVSGFADDRYFYYPAAAAALLVAVSLGWAWTALERLQRRPARLAHGTLVLLLATWVALGGASLLVAERSWDTAGAIARKIVTQTVRLVPDPPPGTRFCYRDLPDTVRGKYVFRNGITEALFLTYGHQRLAAFRAEKPPPGGCSILLAWTGAQLRREGVAGSRAPHPTAPISRSSRASRSSPCREAA